jgi:hypothetical protein
MVLALDVALTQAAIRGKLDALAQDVQGYPDILRQVAEEYSQFRDSLQVRETLDKVTDLFRECSEVVYPLEDAQAVAPSFEVGGFRPSESEWAREVLEGEAVVGIDTSEIQPTTHRSPSFLLENVGFSMMQYQKNTPHLDGSKTYFHPYSELVDRYARGTSSTLPSWAVDVTRMECELDSLKSLLGGEKTSRVTVLFDESFSASWLNTVSPAWRAGVVSEMKRLQSELLQMGTNLVGVFYTSSSAFVTMVRMGLGGAKGKRRDVDWRRVRDSRLLMRVLPSGWRSPVFRVRSRITDQFDLRVVGFYLKAGEGSVFRVEFPEKLLERVEVVHRVVAAEAALGGGYPYVLHRAHEEAYISPGERQWVFDYVNRLLGEDAGLVDGVQLSMKEMRKLVGLV